MSTAIAVEKTVRELATENPSIISVFQRYGIDFCCGGEDTLTDACLKAKTTTEDVLQAFAADQKLHADRATSRDWMTESMSDVIAHINGTHHVYVRNEIVRISNLLEKVPAKHGERHPELFQVQELFGALANELTVHMMKEEQILFPYIERLEEAKLEGRGAPPASCFGSVENPINMMRYEHENAGEVLKQLRETTNGFAAPADACDSFRGLYKALVDFEADLHMHIHMENNILFPRALAAANA